MGVDGERESEKVKKTEKGKKREVGATGLFIFLLSSTAASIE